MQTAQFTINESERTRIIFQPTKDPQTNNIRPLWTTLRGEPTHGKA